MERMDRLIWEVVDDRLVPSKELKYRGSAIMTILAPNLIHPVTGRPIAITCASSSTALSYRIRRL